MNTKPLRPLILPAILIVVITVIAVILPTFKPIDEALIQLVQATPRSWYPAIALLTKIGDVPNLILVAVIISLWELHRRHHIRSIIMLASLIALPSFYLAKQIVQRARPVSEFIAQSDLHGYSFPSGHATGTMAVYGMIALLVYSHLKGPSRIVVTSISILIIVVVSFSRVYLGAHYPTDILAGWLLAFVIISLLRTASLYMANRNSAPPTQAAQDTTETPQTLPKD